MFTVQEPFFNWACDDNGMYDTAFSQPTAVLSGRLGNRIHDRLPGSAWYSAFSENLERLLLPLWGRERPQAAHSEAGALGQTTASKYA